MHTKSWRIGVGTTTKTGPIVRSGTRSRSRCIIPATQPARRHDRAGKLQHPAVQGWGAAHEPKDSRYERGTTGGQVKTSDLAKAFRHGLSCWSSFSPFLEDERVAIDNNPAERDLKPIGVGRRNWFVAGSDTGGETLARALTVIKTAKMNGLYSQAYLADVLDRIHAINRAGSTHC